MRRHQLQKRNRNSLVWYLVGFVAVQLGLAVGVDRFWPAIRDPDYRVVEQIVRSRQQEAPGRPLVLFLGSSRTQMGLSAGRLNVPDDPRAPVVCNAAILGGGPMMNGIVLRRLLDAGLRPRMVFAEVMPLSLSKRQGAAVEERQTFLYRYSLGEVVSLWPYFGEPYRLCWHWGRGRVFPCGCHRVELREALGIDIPGEGAMRASLRDASGWDASPRPWAPTEIARLTRLNLAWYEDALTQPALAPGTMRAVRDLVRLCQEERIIAVLVVPPEGSCFRNRMPAVEEAQMSALCDLAHALSVPLVDARAWVEDAGFWDGHHLTELGAVQYTDRFAREVRLRRLWPQGDREGEENPPAVAAAAPVLAGKPSTNPE
jgi:hypothetical protein